MEIGKTQGAIYRQITEYFYYEIASGRLEKGARIDSIRNLALSFKVNPNTIQKALADLEREGLIYTDSTNGKFITTDDRRIQTLRHKLYEAITMVFIKNTKDLGASLEEVLGIVNARWDEK